MAAMRNDSRPIFKDSPASPVGGQSKGDAGRQPDSRDTIAHGRESHIVHEETEKRQPTEPDDSVTPSSDTSGRTRI
jgi:hypothetical protein